MILAWKGRNGLEGHIKAKPTRCYMRLAGAGSWIRHWVNAGVIWFREKWEDQDSVFILGGRCLLSFETLGALSDLGYPGKDIPSEGLEGR